MMGAERHRWVDGVSQNIVQVTVIRQSLQSGDVYLVVGTAIVVIRGFNNSPFIDKLAQFRPSGARIACMLVSGVA